MSSSEEDFPEEYVMYKDREDWKDIVPLPQDDGPNAVVKILYSEKFTDVYDYFRAIMDKREYSERALRLTEDAVRLNSANYTVWHYRRDILKALKLDLKEELAYVEEVIESSPKNYQVWHHRRVIVEWLNDPSQELGFTAQILESDAKNYHAWQHRQWVILTFNLWDDELRYTDYLISKDIRNNSAWNQRFFVLQHTGFSPDVIDHEIHFVMNRIQIITGNESSWNYLRGVLQQTSLKDRPDVYDFALELFEKGSRSPHFLAFLFDLYVERFLNEDDDEAEGKAMEVCKMLETKYDIIRCKYWKYMGDHFKLKVQRARNEDSKQEQNSRESVSV